MQSLALHDVEVAEVMTEVTEDYFPGMLMLHEVVKSVVHEPEEVLLLTEEIEEWEASLEPIWAL